MEDKKKFWSSLLDMSFDELITKDVISILYMVGIGIAAITAVVLVISAFGQSFAVGLLHVIAAPIVFVLIVIILRIELELVMTLFKIEENTRKVEAAVAAESIPAQESEAEDNE